jgi:hypothetical protein
MVDLINDGPCFDQTIEINKAHANTNKDDLFMDKASMLVNCYFVDRQGYWLDNCYLCVAKLFQ